jgi:hypothetical protein
MYVDIVAGGVRQDTCPLIESDMHKHDPETGDDRSYTGRRCTASSGREPTEPRYTVHRIAEPACTVHSPHENPAMRGPGTKAHLIHFDSAASVLHHEIYRRGCF